MLKLLFVCIGNACRSQMAEGFARKYGEGKIEVFSAGIMPLNRVTSKTVKVMAEKGIDVSSQRPKHIDEVLHEAPFDLIVFLDNNINLHNLPGKKIITRPVPDPFERDIEAYRRTRDKVEELVVSLVAQLEVE